MLQFFIVIGDDLVASRILAAMLSDHYLRVREMKADWSPFSRASIDFQCPGSHEDTVKREIRKKILPMFELKPRPALNPFPENKCRKFRPAEDVQAEVKKVIQELTSSVSEVA